MVSELRRTPFNSTTLIRLLAELTVADVADSKQSFAERLAHWLNWTDAISLSVALNGSTVKAPDGQSGAPSSASSAAKEFARVRTALANALAAKGAPAAAPDYAPYHHHYVSQQRAMEAGIGPLRAQVRSALADQSPASSRLAALDAVLDDVLREREHSLLSTVPLLLEKHFERLRKAHQETHADTQASDDAWLAIYCKDMQGVLLAELNLRLQPVEGLLEALGHESTRPQ